MTAIIKPQYRYMTTAKLLELNAKDFGTRQLDPKYYPRLDPKGIHILDTFPITGVLGFARCHLMVKELDNDKPVQLHFDLSWEDFEDLPSADNVKACPECKQLAPMAKDDYVCIQCRVGSE